MTDQKDRQTNKTEKREADKKDTRTANRDRSQRENLCLLIYINVQPLKENGQYLLFRAKSMPVCVPFLDLLDTWTKMDTELDN